MKKILLISGVLLALTATVASAGGINLYWNDCGPLGGGTGVTDKTFACASNSGNNDLYITFEPNANIPDVNGSNPIVDLQSASDPMPAWWQFKNAGTCRLTALSGISAITGTCTDTWAGQGTAAIAAYYTTGVLPSMPTNRTRILGLISVPGVAAANVDPGTEYFDLLVRVTNAKTVNAGCGGCNVPVCLVLNEVLLTTNNSGDFRLFNPINSNFATWQGGVIAAPGCPAATPTQNKTWGQVKSIYR